LAGSATLEARQGNTESHVYLVQLGQNLSQVDLVGVETEEEAVVALAQARAAEVPPGTWILGSGWDEGAWANRYPGMDLLSERVPNHPVYLRGLHAAITRRDKELQPPGGRYPQQVMTPEEAVRGYTVWGAYAEWLDQRTGVIREGMWADLTIMDLDPFVVGATHPASLLSGRIMGTVSRGAVVFDALN
jgi:predicted amidohydrolase YtcJ